MMPNQTKNEKFKEDKNLKKKKIFLYKTKREIGG